MASISSHAKASSFAARLCPASNATRPGVSSVLSTSLCRIRSRRERPSFICCASDTSSRKLIASSEIPLVYPREDFTLQLFRWATIEAEANGLQNFGAPIDIQPALKDPNAADGESELWGFDAYILRDGETVCQIGVYMDHERVEKHEFIGIGEDRFPVKEGRVEVLDGKKLEIWKVGGHVIDEDTRDVVRRFCESLSLAIETYSSFGSCFSDDMS